MFSLNLKAVQFGSQESPKVELKLPGLHRELYALIMQCWSNPFKVSFLEILWFGAQVPDSTPQTNISKKWTINFITD